MRSTVGTVMPWRSWKLLAWGDPELAQPWYHFVCLMIYLALNNQRSWDMSLSDTEAMKAAYSRHYTQICEICPQDQLLELKLGDGWGELCKFLGKEVPSNAYPKINDKEFFIAFRVKMLNRATKWAVQKILIFATPLALLASASYYIRRRSPW